MSVCCKVGIEGRSSSQTSRAGLSSRIAMTWGMIRSSNRSQPVIEEVVPIKSSAAAAASHAEEEVVLTTPSDSHDDNEMETVALEEVRSRFIINTNVCLNANT